jgi:hypothetical protein
MFGLLKEALNDRTFGSVEDIKAVVVHCFFTTAGASMGCLPQQPWALFLMASRP